MSGFTIHISALITLLLASVSTAQTQWTVISNADGITVFRDENPRPIGIDTITVRGEAIIDATVEDVSKVMADNSTATEWMPLMKERVTLEKVRENERIEFTLLDLPWPMSDRFCINRGQREFTADGGQKLSIKSVALDEYSGDYPGKGTALEHERVRAVLHYSEFILTPIDNGMRTKIRLEVNSDPKGSIPKWMVNIAQKDWPRDFIRGLREQLKKRGLIKTTTIAH